MIIIIIIIIIIVIIIIIIIIEVKTSLGALSKNFVTLVRAKSARITAIWIGDRYMR